jgi:hypothetical protein
MQSVFRFVIPIIAACAIATTNYPSFAQGQPQAVKQIQLNETQIQNLIAAQKEISKLTENMKEGSKAKPDPKVIAAIQAAAKKNGFADFKEYNSVYSNVSMIMSGLDPKTKEFSEPKVAIQKEIDEVKADKSISQAAKKEQLEELNQALKTAEPIKFTSNIELVKKYYDQIDEVME